MMDFSGSAGAGSDFDLLPKGLLVFAVLTVRGVKTSATPSRYLDVELTVDQGQPYAGRKLWDKIGDPFFQGNSESYRQMGMVAITRILEAGRGASPTNPGGYKLDDFAQLNGVRVAIKVGIEAGNDGHDDKNRVAEWLTPNPASQSGYKGYAKLMSGDHGVQKTGGQAQPGTGFGGAPATQQGGGFGASGGFGQGGAAPATGQPSTAGFGNAGSGFSQPPADSSGQPGANGATTADSQTQTGASASPSDPQQTPGWLAQAGGAPA